MISSGGAGKGSVVRLHEKLARDLGRKIVSNGYSPGQILDTEIYASDRYQVSRAAYREAVRTLGAKGLVTSRPHVGTRVLPRRKWHLLDPDVLSWMFESKPDEQMIEALFEFRLIVEPEASSLAAERRTNEHLDRMKHCLAVMQDQTLSSDQGRAADHEFHATLLIASGNPFLRTLTSSIATAVAWTTELKQRMRPLIRDPITDHLDVFEAIVRRDRKAARTAMRKLIELALSDSKSAPQKDSDGRG